MEAAVKKTGCFMIMIIMCVSLCGCPMKEKAMICSTLHDFEKSCHEMDVEGMLDCVEPSLRAIIWILPIPKDSEKLRNLLIKIIDILYMIDVDSADGVLDFIESFQITPRSIEIDSRSAYVDAEISYKAGRDRNKTSVTIHMVERGGKWYISL